MEELTATREIWGDECVARALELLNDLAPVTRRDDWWGTEGPIEIIIQHLRKPPPVVSQ